MATADAGGRGGEPSRRLVGGVGLSKVFELRREGLNVQRGLVILAVFVVPAVVLAGVDKEQYFLSVAFGALFVCLDDPGGPYAVRIQRMAIFALIGAGLTALGYWVPSTMWGWVVAAMFLVTLLSGLAVKYGIHRFVTAMLLNTWFLIVISLPAGFQLSGITSSTWGQTLAWLIGGALWIAVTFLGWLARGREDRPPPVPEIPGAITPKPLTKPLVAFATLRAIALAITVAIAFGFDLPYADWMPIAALVAMRPSLDQTALFAKQRLAGALIGAVVASIFLVTIDSKHALRRW